MENSEAYSIMKALMEKNLLVIRNQELVEWLYRLYSTRQITKEEVQDLLELAHQLNICDLPINEALLAIFN